MWQLPLMLAPSGQRYVPPKKDVKLENCVKLQLEHRLTSHVSDMICCHFLIGYSWRMLNILYFLMVVFLRIFRSHRVGFSIRMDGPIRWCPTVSGIHQQVRHGWKGGSPGSTVLLVDAVLTIVDGSFKGQHMRILSEIFEIWWPFMVVIGVILASYVH